MAENKTPSDTVRVAIAQNIEQARGAMTNYFQFLEKSMSTSPLGETDQARKFRSYVERNVAASFEFSDKLLHAKDFQDIVRIQTEFFQTQLRALTDQNKGLGDNAATTASEVINVPIK
jgi:phasin